MNPKPHHSQSTPQEVTSGLPEGRADDTYTLPVPPEGRFSDLIVEEPDDKKPVPLSPDDNETRLLPSSASLIGHQLDNPAAVSSQAMDHDLVRLSTAPPNKLGRRALTWLLAGTVITTGLGVLANRSSDGSDKVLSYQPPVTAGPAPLQARPLPTTEAPLTTSTTLESVRLNSSSTIPSTTVVVRTPNTPASIAPSTTAEAKVKTPEAQILTAEKKQAIIETTGYTGLEGHKLAVLPGGEFSSTTDPTVHNVLIGVDGAVPAMSIEEIKATLAATETNIIAHPTFTSRMRIGTGEPEDIKIKVSSSHLNSGADITNYLLFVGPDKDIISLSAPVQVVSRSENTINRPYAKTPMNVAIIGSEPGAKIDGLDADRVATTTGIAQLVSWFDLDSATDTKLATSKPDMSYITTSPNYQDQRNGITYRAREQYNISVAFAREFRGTYAEYKVAAQNIPLVNYPDNKLFLLVVGQQQFNDIRA